MKADAKINIETFKIVTKAIAESDNLELMANHLSQLLVAALEIKGCTIFVINPSTKELEILASFGLSSSYLSKGPIMADKSIGCTVREQPVIIRDVKGDERLQYPAEAQKEGIAAILSVPIILLGEIIGCLRLYHFQKWDISEKDVDSLLVLAEIIGLAMRYTSLLNAAQTFHDVLRNLPVDLGPPSDMR